MNEIKLGSNKSFGIVFFIFFFIISIYPVLYSEDIRIWSLIISFSFLVLGLINSRLLTPLNRLWFKFGIYIGRFVSPVVIGIIFFALITPISILSKIFKRDELNLRRNTDKNSYWKIREVEVDKKSFERQY